MPLGELPSSVTPCPLFPGLSDVCLVGDDGSSESSLGARAMTASYHIRILVEYLHIVLKYNYDVNHESAWTCLGVAGVKVRDLRIARVFGRACGNLRGRTFRALANCFGGVNGRLFGKIRSRGLSGVHPPDPALPTRSFGHNCYQNLLIISRYTSISFPPHPQPEHSYICPWCTELTRCLPRPHQISTTQTSKVLM